MFIGISNTPRDYAWGSRSAIAEFRGVEPSGSPEAELWLGAHEGSPARVHDAASVGHDDLAAWIVTCAEQRTTGDYDGVGEVLALGDLLAQVGAGVGSDATLTWVPQEFLTEQGVEPWMGPEALPLWLPRPEYDGLGSHDPEPSYAAGLELRPIADTARDTLAWVRATPDAPVSGMSRDREAAVLEAWHSLRE